MRAAGLVRRVWQTIRIWRRRAEERASLSRFSERDMRDVGLSPWDVQWEIAKPFWRE
jgi:uncharacterized protein YjiS (DUF1127 family)